MMQMTYVSGIKAKLMLSSVKVRSVDGSIMMSPNLDVAIGSLPHIAASSHCSPQPPISTPSSPIGQPHLADRLMRIHRPTCTMPPSFMQHPPMNTPSSSPPDLPDTVERLAASVVCLATRRYGSAGVLWR